jgi:type I restriction enzyme S subunit
MRLNNIHNCAINHNLEAMAKQLYDYWFVQFDFPDENGKPYKSSGGKMVWNEKLNREIPEKWHSMSIGNYAPCKGGYAFKSQDFCDKGLPVIKIGNIQEDYTLNMTDCQCIDGFNNKQFYATKFDLVIAMTGATIGKFAISQRDYWVNQRVGRFDLENNPLSKLGYLVNSLKQEYFREQIFQIASGCAQPNISSDQIDSISILQPEYSMLFQFNQFCQYLLNQQSENILQIDELTKLRDQLLPLLMNGQVSVNYDLLIKESLYLKFIFIITEET